MAQKKIDPKLFEHLQWKQGMTPAEKRIGESGSQGSDDLDSQLTGETITLPSGLIVSKSSDKSLSLPEAVAYATSRNGYLQNADLAILVRDELDLHPFEKQDGTTGSDFSDEKQITSTLCLFHQETPGALRMYVSDLYSMYGNDRTKHQESADQIKQGITLQFNHELCTLLTHKAGNRNAILPDNYKPLTIPCTDLPANPISTAIFPTQSQRFADYLQRKTLTHANFYLIGISAPFELNDPNQCIIRPLRFGGVGCDDVSRVDAGGGLIIKRRARGVAQKYFEAKQ